MTFDYQYIDPGPDDPGCTKNRYFALNVSSLCVKRLAQSKFYILVNERETIKPGFHIKVSLLCLQAVVYVVDENTPCCYMTSHLHLD